MVAEGLDTEQKTDVHGRALTAALTAMKEAEDFLPGGSRLEADADLPRIIAAHATPVLKKESTRVTSMTALNCYFTFAQEQFAVAAGGEVAGSMALHALGKLHNAMAQQEKRARCRRPSPRRWSTSRPRCWHIQKTSWQPMISASCWRGAAITPLPGRCSSTASRSRPQSATWHNLAVVYGQLGQAMLARQAGQQAAALRQAELARRRAARERPTIPCNGSIRRRLRRHRKRSQHVRRDPAALGRNGGSAWPRPVTCRRYRRAQSPRKPRQPNECLGDRRDTNDKGQGKR